jgi:hypothetical protein
MTYMLLRFAHLVGLMLIAAGLIGVFVSDIRSRQARGLVVFAEAVRSIAVFYDGLVVPGALLLVASGTWLVVDVHGGWGAFDQPWLAGMALLFAFEFLEGNTVTRLYFMRLRRLSREALRRGVFTAELMEARGATAPTFTHFLDLPILMVIVALGVLRPDDWTLFFVGSAAAVVVAALLTTLLPRLYQGEPTIHASVGGQG